MQQRYKNGRQRPYSLALGRLVKQKLWERLDRPQFTETVNDNGLVCVHTSYGVGVNPPLYDVDTSHEPMPKTSPRKRLHTIYKINLKLLRGTSSHQLPDRDLELQPCEAVSFSLDPCWCRQLKPKPVPGTCLHLQFQMMLEIDTPASIHQLAALPKICGLTCSMTSNRSHHLQPLLPPAESTVKCKHVQMCEAVKLAAGSELNNIWTGGVASPFCAQGREPGAGHPMAQFPSSHSLILGHKESF
ncbi:uncharacterized protein LOC117812951 isoform X1 [Xyrichtys novacula]|uniref:Uncharacterized protein LOC117812951 isoform X1 n=1 Tax=Xyrichtys novacula TaxID=13765 RepID=A0AAV1GHB0_XYRNO|nr:uncharacterized protein LOC117812951 isoform X1 [Xyrichtys novacula]